MRAYRLVACMTDLSSFFPHQKSSIDLLLGTSRTSNEEVLERAGMKREILKVICKSDLHILYRITYIYRKGKGHLESIVLAGKIEGKRARKTLTKT